MKTEERKTATELLTCIGDTDNVLFLSSVKVGEFSAVLSFFFSSVLHVSVKLRLAWPNAMNMSRTCI